MRQQCNLQKAGTGEVRLEDMCRCPGRLTGIDVRSAMARLSSKDHLL